MNIHQIIESLSFALLLGTDWLPAKLLLIPFILEKVQNDLTFLWRVVRRQKVGLEKMGDVLTVEKQEDTTGKFRWVFEWFAIWTVAIRIQRLWSLFVPLFDCSFALFKVLLSVLLKKIPT
jgi:hypothetical protein